MFRQALIVGGLDRQQLRHGGLLRHRVHELRIGQEQSIDLALAVRIQHDLDGADQVLDVRAVTESCDAAQHGGAKPAEECRALAADDRQTHLSALVLPFPHLQQYLLEQVRVQAAGQGRDQWR